MRHTYTTRAVYAIALILLAASVWFASAVN